MSDSFKLDDFEMDWSSDDDELAIIEAEEREIKQKLGQLQERKALARDKRAIGSAQQIMNYLDQLSDLFKSGDLRIIYDRLKRNAEELAINDPAFSRAFRAIKDNRYGFNVPGEKLEFYADLVENLIKPGVTLLQFLRIISNKESAKDNPFRP